MPHVLKQTYTGFFADKCPQLAAALAYYAVFSMPPLLVIVITLASYGASMVSSAEGGDARDLILTEVRQALGSGAAEQVDDVIQRASRLPRSYWGAAISVVAFLFGASGVMVQLQASLNTVWRVSPDPRAGGVKHFLVKRLLSFAMVLGVGFVLLVSLLVSTALSAVGHYLKTNLGVSLLMLSPAAVHGLAQLVVFTLMFAALFKWLPDAEVAWRDVARGSLVTAALFIAGKGVLSIYFAQMDIGSSYGAAGSLALILLWVYYSGMILLLGAEFTHAIAVDREGDPKPEPGAVGSAG